MSRNRYALAARHYTGGQLDRPSREALVQSANRIAAVGDRSRFAMHEMTTNYFTAARLATQGLVAANCMASRAPQTPMTQGFFSALTQNFLQRMVLVNDIANDKIIRCVSFEDD